MQKNKICLFLKEVAKEIITIIVKVIHIFLITIGIAACMTTASQEITDLYYIPNWNFGTSGERNFGRKKSSKFKLAINSKILYSWNRKVSTICIIEIS